MALNEMDNYAKFSKESENYCSSKSDKNKLYSDKCVAEFVGTIVLKYAEVSEKAVNCIPKAALLEVHGNNINFLTDDLPKQLVS